MRDDSGVDFSFALLAAISALVLISSIRPAFRRGVDSPTWELRWRGLAPDDRARIAAAARTGEELADPDDSELAAGLRHRTERHDAYFHIAVLALPVAAAILAITGVTGGGFASLAIAISGIGTGLWFRYRDRLIGQGPRPAGLPDGS
jgi:hypothetical protein